MKKAIVRAEKLDPDKEALFIIQDDKEMSLVHYKRDCEGAGFKNDVTKGSWGASKRSLAQVEHITHDWLTPCEYIPYIDALLKNIDLDPCSTYDANNQFLRAKNIYI